jgi:hypothetical protein
MGGRSSELPPDFVVAEFKYPARELWAERGRIFATVGAAERSGDGLEIFMMTSDDSTRHAELLAIVSHYHLTGNRLDLHHIVNIGEPWTPGSPCTYAYLSLPYAFGPSLEWLSTPQRRTRCLWLVPITASERELLLTSGVEALESRFEQLQPDLTSPQRSSVVN